MDLKDRILAYMREEAYKPLLAENLAEALALEGEDLVAFGPALEALEKEGAIIKNRSDLYGVPSRMHLVVGRLSMTAKGFGFIIPDTRETEEETDVFVPGTALSTAMHGDRVVARVTPSLIEGKSREGEIIRVLERANKRIVGTFEASKSFGFVTPDNVKLTQDVFIPKRETKGAKTGMKVVVEVTKWPDGRRNAEGKVVEILGRADAPGVDVLSVMREYDLSEEFPEEVQQAAEACEQEPSPEEYRGRKDRRDLPIVTVDGEDSKDLDDGVFARKNADGSFFLGVYIADVSWYVRENQPLDREARERGTSVYLVDRVIPMLPKELSNGICSLNAGVDRLSMACEMEISPEGEVTKYEIVPTVIHVYRRLTYNIVNKVLVAKEEPFLSDNQDIQSMLETLAELRNVLKAKRHRRGSIDFDLPEVKVKLDEKGHPVALIKREGSLAESIIEECMLIANETVARHMDEKHLPFLYRVHEQPEKEKIERLNSLLSAFGLFVRQSEGGDIQPKDVQQALVKVEGRPEERIVSAVALRSMQQARYSELSLGHFGLAARYYTHFTSPIRRYPDLIVHRLLRETFETGTMPRERQERLKSILPEIAEHSSARERIAVEAERATTDMKKIEYMAQFIGDTFDGVISGVTQFGIFVELDNGVEGLVHVSTMADDFYEYREDIYAMVGERTNRMYQLGGAVQVVLIKANQKEHTLDFVLKDNAAEGIAPDRAKSARGLKGDTAAKGEGNQSAESDQPRKKRGGRDGRRDRGRRKRDAEGIVAEVDTEAAAKEPRKKHGKRTERGEHGETREETRGEKSKERRGEGRGKRSAEAPQEGEARRRQKIERKGTRALGESRTRREVKKKPRTEFRDMGETRAPRDYHRVKVTGLTSAVWPDPPGYVSRERQEAQRTEAEREKKEKKAAPKRRPRPHRKTEAGTSRD